MNRAATNPLCSRAFVPELAGCPLISTLSSSEPLGPMIREFVRLTKEPLLLLVDARSAVSTADSNVAKPPRKSQRKPFPTVWSCDRASCSPAASNIAAIDFFNPRLSSGSARKDELALDAGKGKELLDRLPAYRTARTARFRCFQAQALAFDVDLASEGRRLLQRRRPVNAISLSARMPKAFARRALLWTAQAGQLALR